MAASHVWDKLSVSLQGCTSKPTPNWDDLGCGGMNGEGVAGDRIGTSGDLVDRDPRNLSDLYAHGIVKIR